MSMTEKDLIMIEAHKEMINKFVFPSCLNCEHWADNRVGGNSTGTKQCLLYNALPPPEVIVYGCPDYLADIPF